MDPYSSTGRCSKDLRLYSLNWCTEMNLHDFCYRALIQKHFLNISVYHTCKSRTRKNQKLSLGNLSSRVSPFCAFWKSPMLLWLSSFVWHSWDNRAVCHSDLKHCLSFKCTVDAGCQVTCVCAQQYYWCSFSLSRVLTSSWTLAAWTTSTPRPSDRGWPMGRLQWPVQC